MAETHSFRSALGGFNKEDVVHYIEYLSAKHTALVNQLTSEAEELRAKLIQYTARDGLASSLEAKCAELTELLEKSRADYTALEEKYAALEAECAELRTKTGVSAEAQAEIDSLKARLERQDAEMAGRELAAYRRAERAERTARERADQIYRQATGTLAQATTQVDDAAALFRQAADRIGSQMAELQSAVESGKNALLDAAATMYAIRPEDPEE